VQNIDDSELVINITNDTLSVDLSGLSGAYLHSINTKEYSYEDISDDIFITISLALIHIKKTADILEVFQLISSDSKTLQNPEIALQFISEFAIRGNNKEVIQLWENIPKSSKDDFINMQFKLITYFASKDNKELSEYFLLKQIDDYKNLEDKSQLGVAYYNYANFLRIIDYKKSFSFYNKALKNNPHYYTEDYIFKEIGGLLFDLDRYVLSSKCYKFGLELKKDLRSLVLYADALMLKGDYLESQKIFKQYFNETKDDIDNEWILKEAVSNYLITEMNITNQSRNYYRAMNQNIIKNNENNELEYINIITNIDALNPLCWFNLSILYGNEKKEPLKVMIGFIICALINKADEEACLNAVKSAFNVREYEIILVIISVGYSNCRELFINKLYDFIEHDGNHSESTQKFLDIIESAINKVNDHNSKNDSISAIRIFDGNRFKNIID
jgi:tetratricopeptide (TPR) repeat protein